MSLTAIITAADPYGSLHALAHYLRRAGASCRVITLGDAPQRGGPYDIAHVPDGGAELEHVLATATTFHLVDLLPAHARFPHNTLEHCLREDTRLVLQRDRPASGLEARSWQRAAERYGCPIVATRPDCMPDVATNYLPPFIPWWRGPLTPLLPGARARSRRAHVTIFAACPGELRDEPGLEQLVELAESIASSRPHVRVELLPRTTADVARRRRRHADVALDGGVQGLSPAGLEALAQGVPVVSPLSKASVRVYGSELPVYAPEALEAIVERISPLADPDPSVSAWARKHCDPQLYCVSSSSSARQPSSMTA